MCWLTGTDNDRIPCSCQTLTCPRQSGHGAGGPSGPMLQIGANHDSLGTYAALVCQVRALGMTRSEMILQKVVLPASFGQHAELPTTIEKKLRIQDSWPNSFSPSYRSTTRPANPSHGPTKANPSESTSQLVDSTKRTEGLCTISGSRHGLRTLLPMNQFYLRFFGTEMMNQA